MTKETGDKIWISLQKIAEEEEKILLAIASDQDTRKPTERQPLISGMDLIVRGCSMIYSEIMRYVPLRKA